MTFESLKTVTSRVTDYLTGAKPEDKVLRSQDNPSTMDISAFARAKGSKIFNYGVREDSFAGTENQPIDSPAERWSSLKTNYDACSYIADRAQARSALHLRALQMIDPIERALIRTRCGKPGL